MEKEANENGCFCISWENLKANRWYYIESKIRNLIDRDKVGKGPSVDFLFPS